MRRTGRLSGASFSRPILAPSWKSTENSSKIGCASDHDRAQWFDKTASADIKPSQLEERSGMDAKRPRPPAQAKKPLYSLLYVQVLFAILLGVVVGIFFPAFRDDARRQGARRRLHQADQDGDRADHLLHGRLGHRPYPGRRARSGASASRRWSISRSFRASPWSLAWSSAMCCSPARVSPATATQAAVAKYARRRRTQAPSIFFSTSSRTP